jgi:Domain of unknown function (DUF5666)
MNVQQLIDCSLALAGRHGLRALFVTLALVGCGGGADSGGTGVNPQSYASGPITGFGSVIVNGVRFDDTGASVTDDEGAPRSRDDLRLGMTTEVRGSAITVDGSGASVSTATSIAFGSDLLGPVDSVDVPGNRLVLLGQGVDIGATTVLEDIGAGGLASIAAGDVIEVYALYDAATGRYTATRVERKGAVATYRLRGIVSQLDTVARAFNIGSERISYAAFAGNLPAALANGNFVRVKLQPPKVGGVWQVAGLVDGMPQPKELDDVRLEGLVSAFTSVTRFSVNGVAVDASGVAPPPGLALGARVEVEGVVRNGLLVASELKVKSSDDTDNQEFELRGAITSVDLATRTFVLRGVTVEYLLVGTPTDFRDGTAANLAVGANVEARGTLSADGTRLLAARITFK